MAGIEYGLGRFGDLRDRKSTRLNSSHSQISYAVFCLKKKNKASCYDVDGTDPTSLVQYSGRVHPTYNHSVPRSFVTNHGTMFNRTIVRFPTHATTKIQ